MNIEELPDEILLNILNRLTFRQLLTCSLLSSRWFNLINDSYKIMRNVKLHINERVWEDIIKQATTLTRTYRTAAMHCVQVPTDFAIDFDTIESLMLNCCTFESLGGIWNLLKECKSLKQLSMSYPNLVNGEPVHRVACDVVLPMKSLDEFRCALFLSQDNQCCQSWQILKIFKQLSLKVKRMELKLHVKDGFNGMDSTDKMIAYLLENYLDSLKSLEVQGDSCSALFYSLNECQLMNRTKFRLERLKICVRTVNAGVFERFMATQNELTQFQFDAVTTENQIEIAYTNLANLTYLQLALRELGDTESLCDNIGALTKLQVLKLDNFDFNPCHLHLPKSLRVLDIFSFSYPTVAKTFRFHSDSSLMDNMEELVLNDVYLEIEEMSNFLSKMPNLKRLSLCDSHTPWEGLCSVLAMLMNLKCLELTQQYMHDEILTQIKATNLSRLVWMHSYNDVMVKRVTERSLQHLDDTCKQLNVIQHGSGNILFRRNAKTRNFEKYWRDY